MDRTYNGWTNYATWRINLEMFDGMSPRDIVGVSTCSAYDLSLHLNQYATDVICDSTEPGPARDYALAFLSDVDWREIAQHMVDAYADETEDA